MATISKCKICGKPVPPSNPILIDENRIPYRVCSTNCVSNYQEREAAEMEAAADWDTRCARAIARGEAESGRKFEDAGDGLILSWIDKYAYDEETQNSDSQKFSS